MYNALSPTITQVEYSREEIAEGAFKMLMEMIDSQGKIPESRHLEGRFIKGESTSRQIQKDAGMETGTKEHISKAISVLQKALKGLE